jgi:hypothetical protein
MVNIMRGLKQKYEIEIKVLQKSNMAHMGIEPKTKGLPKHPFTNSTRQASL